MKGFSLIFFILFSTTGVSIAGACTPEVNSKKVLVEILGKNGGVVFSKLHKVRKKDKYAGLISSNKAFEALEESDYSNFKIGTPKFKLELGGVVTKISMKDGSAIAKIGGCPISKLKFYSLIGKDKKPFIHQDVVELAAKSLVVVESSTTE